MFWRWCQKITKWISCIASIWCKGEGLVVIQGIRKLSSFRRTQQNVFWGDNQYRMSGPALEFKQLNVHDGKHLIKVGIFTCRLLHFKLNSSSRIIRSSKKSWNQRPKTREMHHWLAVLHSRLVTSEADTSTSASLVAHTWSINTTLYFFLEPCVKSKDGFFQIVFRHKSRKNRHATGFDIFRKGTREEGFGGLSKKGRGEQFAGGETKRKGKAILFAWFFLEC